MSAQGVSASLHVELGLLIGSPYTVLALDDGTDQLDRVDPAAPIPDLPSTPSLGVVTRALFTAGGPQSVDVDVSDAIAQSWTAPSAAVLFRIGFPAAPAGPDAAAVYAPCADGPTQLTLSYLTP